MKFERPLEQKPANLDKLEDKERIARLHHQLSLMYDRVFLTGDWSGEHLERKALRENPFEDLKITDRKIFVDALNDFIDEAGNTVAHALEPKLRTTLMGKRETNRTTLLDIYAHARDILTDSEKDGDTKEETEMLKCLDENIHHFRDVPVIKGQRARPEEQDVERYGAALDGILEELETIVVDYSDRKQGPPMPGPFRDAA